MRIVINSPRYISEFIIAFGYTKPKLSLIKLLDLIKGKKPKRHTKSEQKVRHNLTHFKSFLFLLFSR